jgi:hypothetical protein
MFYHPLISRLVLTVWRPWLLGKRMIVGMTELTAARDLIEQRQFVGRIIAVDPKRGITLQLRDANHYYLPPDHRAIKRARKGEYKLRSTDEVIVDPDYLSTWELVKPPAS